MKRLILGWLFAILNVSFVLAQTPVTTQPYPSTTNNLSSSISSTNIFQNIQSADTKITGRVACTIQNIGTNIMFVFFGPIANATTPSSFKISSGQSVSCNVGPIILKDQVSITGTAGEQFYAGFQ